MHSKVNSFFILILTVFCINSANAQQMSSEEKSKIKKQLKLYLKNPGVFKREQENLTNEIASQTKTIVSLKERAENAESTLKKLKEENERLAEDNEVKTQIIADLNKRLNAASSYCQPGEYKVQIGKFDKYSLESYLRRGKCINFEVQNGVTVYTIDGFSDAKEAFNMAQQMRRMGMKGAFVTRFVNNKRVDYDHLKETDDKPIYDISEDNPNGGVVKSKPVAVAPAPQKPIYVTPTKTKSMMAAESKNVTITTPAKTNVPATAVTPAKPQPIIKYVSPSGIESEKNEGYGNTNVKLNDNKKVVVKPIIIDEEDEVELNNDLNSSDDLKSEDDEDVMDDVQIKDFNEPVKKTGGENISLPSSKPKDEENLEDYEEVKEIPENF